MNKKIIFILIGGLLLLLLILGLWFWFFGRHKDSGAANTGTFGTAQNSSNGQNGAGTGGNTQTTIGTQTGTNTGTSGTGTGGTGTNTDVSVTTGGYTYTPSNPNYPGTIPTTPGVTGGTYTPETLPSTSGVPTVTWDGGDYVYTYPNATSTYPITQPPDVTWLGVDGFTNRFFTPTPINDLRLIDISGTGLIGTNNGDPNDNPGGLDIFGNLLGVGVSGIIGCTPGLLANLGITGAVTAAVLTPGGIPNKSYTGDTIAGIGVGIQASEKTEDFLSCIARGIARAAIQQITASIVDWVNSGFNGQPSFVQNYEEFFSSVADQAAGEFIQGSALAFLCSPFQLQIKIAIAQSYATRRGSAPSCTLSQVVGNIQEFMDGNFSEGGWGGLISFTTEPTNNPFGAYMYAQVAFNNKVIADTREAQNRISPGGFLAQTERTCTGRDSAGNETGCTEKIVTPGQVIEGNLRKALDVPIDENLLADSFDEIINALINQLINRVLYEGLANISGENGYVDTYTSPLDQQGMEAAQALLTNLQGAVQLAQQYGSTQQGSVADIQNAQRQLNTLYNCWATAASSTSLTASQITQAQANAAAANTSINTLETRVSFYNDRITRANTAITTIEQLQTNALAATTLAGVQAVQAQFTAAQNSGALITPAILTTAQQDRTSLQVEMAAQNQTTTQGLAQCNAF